MACAIIAGVLAAVLLGLFANHYVRPFATSEIQGIKLESMVGPMVSMAVILLAFVLVTTAGSFARAQTAAADEARETDYLFELGELTPDPEGRELQAAVACYALAIAALEWPLGEGRTAPEVSTWRNVQAAAMVALAVVLIVVQLAILDLDRPFRGVISVPPTDMARVAGDLSGDFTENYPGVPLPCDAQGIERA